MRQRSVKHGCLWLLPILAVVAAMYWYSDWQKKQPQLNSNPNYFVTIHGHVAPELKGKLSIVFQQEFAASNEKCAYRKAILAPLSYPIKKVDYKVKVSKDGTYSVKIPTDRFVLGYCQWVPLLLNLSMSNDVKNHIFQSIGKYNVSFAMIPIYSGKNFLNMLKQKRAIRNEKLIVQCDRKANDCIFLSKNISFSLEADINHSYKYSINFVVTKKRNKYA